MTGLSRRQAALLAVLLIADGAVVSYAEMGDVVGTAGVNDSPPIREYVHRLRLIGVDCVEVVPRRGCRMVGLPPDWTLETVLAVLDAMRRDGYGVPVLAWRRSA